VVWATGKKVFVAGEERVGGGRKRIRAYFYEKTRPAGKSDITGASTSKKKLLKIQKRSKK